jgi:hypothetical protein
MTRIRAQRGSALLIVTILVMVLSGLAGAYMTMSWEEHRATMHTSAEIHCRQAAASGLDRTRRLLFEIREAGESWDEALEVSRDLVVQSGYASETRSTPSYAMDGDACESGSLGVNAYKLSVIQGTVLPASTDTDLAPKEFFGLNYVNGDTLYNILLADDVDDKDEYGKDDPLVDANDQVVVYVTVASPAEVQPGEIRKILGVYRAYVYYKPPGFVPEHAIIINGNLLMGGSPSVQGLMGSVHANGDLKINGGSSMVISTAGSATGSISFSGTPPEPEHGWNSNASPVPIPRIDPNEHIDKATWLLKSDGSVYDNTTIPPTLVASGTWSGFTFDTKKGAWSKNNGTVPPAGAIFIDGSVTITGGGTASDPWQTTLLVNGTIDMSGNAYITPYLKGVTMMAYGDIELSGNSKAAPELNGLVATHEQIDIQGTPSFRGTVLAEDAADVFPDVTTTSKAGAVDAMDIMGNFSLTYDGGMETFLVAGGTSVALRAWDRCR